MTSIRFPVSLFALAFVMPSTASAQLGPLRRQGFVSALAHGISLDTPFPESPRGLFIKPPGNQSTPPVAWNQAFFPGGPDYSLQAMFGDQAELVEIDGHSTGNDDLPNFEKEGSYALPDLGNGRWLQITTSVANGTTGGEPGSLIYRRVNLDPSQNRNTPGADLYGYYFRDNALIAPELPGTLLLEQSSEAIGYIGPTATEDIDAFDWALGVYLASANGAEPIGLFEGGVNRYYFTISSGSAVNINDSLQGSTSQFAVDLASSAQVEANGATIYMIEWDGGTTPGTWSQPIVYRSAADLGLDKPEDDLDAIALSALSQVTVFSTRLSSARPNYSQLQVNWPGLDGGGSLPLGDRATPPNTGNVEVSKLPNTDDTRDIDSVGFLDPEIHWSSLLLHSHVATPLASPFLPKESDLSMGISVTRGRLVKVKGSVDRLFVQVSGWGTHVIPRAGKVRLYSTNDYDPNDAPATNWVLRDGMIRGATDDVVHFRLLPLPQTPGANPPIPEVFIASFEDQSTGHLSWSTVGALGGR